MPLFRGISCPMIISSYTTKSSIIAKVMSSAKDYFDWHYKITTFFLMIPPKSWWLKILYWPIMVPHLFLVNLSAFLEIAKLCLGGSGEFSADVLNLGIAMLHFMGVNRVTEWLFIRNAYEKVLKRVRGINLDFSAFDKVGSRGIQKSNVRIRRNSVETYQKEKMRQTKRSCLILFISFLSCVCLNISISYSLNYFQRPTYEKWNPALNKTSTYRDYPYPLFYPFDISISDGYYWLGFLYQPYAFVYLMCGFFCVDSLCVNTIKYLTSHVNVIGYALTYIDKNIDKSLESQEVLEVKKERLKICIKELQEIYICAQSLNDIFSSQIFFQMLCMPAAMCCSVYRITTVTVTAEIGYLSCVVCVCASQLFTESWICQEFTLEALQLHQRVYELDWINYPVKLRNTVLFLMTRVQKPFYFTIAYWQPIDVGVFLATIKCSYSFYTLITVRFRRYNDWIN